MALAPGPRDVAALPAACAWGGWAPPDIRHCEENLCGWIAAPADTWSNLAFFAAALWLWRRGGPERRALAAACVAVGATSFFFHASFTAAGQALDYAGMFTATGLLLALNLERLGAAGRSRAFAGLFALSSAAFLALRAARLPVQPIIVVHALGVLGTEGALAARERRGGYGPWAAALALSAAGAGLWVLEYRRIWCDPGNHWLQAHAVWHVLMAGALALLGEFYFRRSTAETAPFLKVTRSLSS